MFSVGRANLSLYGSTGAQPRSQIQHHDKFSICEARVGNQELLERAFRLAESGEVANIQELRRALIEDGATLSDLAQFHGRALAQQLSAKIALANARNRKESGVQDSRGPTSG